MQKKTFYQNGQAKLSKHSKALRSCKLSMDDLTSLFSRDPSELRMRNSNGPIEVLKLQRSTYKKAKPHATFTMANSILASRNSSPNKLPVTILQPSFLEKHKLRQFKFYYQIGFGGFGRVWKVHNREDNKEYAMKELSKRKVIKKNNIESVLNERRILSTLKHPFLINMSSSFQDQHNLYLVMDYLRGGDLRYHICYKESFSDKEIKFIIACIIIGLEYVHKMNIVHKDLKPENIVFQENGYVRITDFGIAKNILTDSQLNHKQQSSGTPAYMAPEILFKKQYSYESDFYAIGVMLHELAMKRRPFQGQNRAQIKESVLKRQISLKQSELPEGHSPALADLITRLLKRAPSQRLGYRGIEEVKNHRYFSEIRWKKLQRKEVKPPFIPNVVSEMKEYLDEIAMFNQMNDHSAQENLEPIDQSTNALFADYDYDYSHPKKLKTNLKKANRVSQRRLQL